MLPGLSQTLRDSIMFACVNSSLDSHMARLVRAGQHFHVQGWVPATSGNFSACVGSRILMTCSGRHKGSLSSADFLTLSESGGEVEPETAKPSAEAPLHLFIYEKLKNVSCVLHTHSLAATFLSRIHAARGRLILQNWEILKGLRGVSDHAHEEVVPIVANSQDMTELRSWLSDLFRDAPPEHAFLIDGHGLYTWGESIDESVRHVEALEFIFELEKSFLLMGKGQ